NKKVLLAISTRSLPFIRRGYFVCNTNPQEKCGSVFASTAPYCLGGCSFAQPSTSIGTPLADVNYLLPASCLAVRFFGCRFTLLSLHFRYVKTSLRSRSRVAVSDRNTATRSAKKSFLRVGINNAFFTSLGVFIVEPHTNALRLFAHFFRRLPKGIYLKKQHYRIGNLPKKSSARLKLISQNQS
ncbi:hypothetical protein, partial [Flavobacterium sp.]|uniref:hypothetical protein n=1 Tax=Flavobacterium sp. TaxID=239 RepID=UPI003752916F